MTRDEMRAQLLAAIKKRLPGERYSNSDDDIEFINIIVASPEQFLDALHGIAIVAPTEVTEEIRQAAWRVHYSSGRENIDIRLWRAMSAAGDLTNPPEKKP